MSIRDIGIGHGLSQEVANNPTRFSVAQLKSMEGKVPGYILYPAIQYVIEQQKRMQLAQSLQQPPVSEQPSVVEQIKQEAAQMGGGVEQLPSNLPQEYAQGGIVAFDGGGEVAQYKKENPPWSRMVQSVLGLPVTEEELEEERIKNERRRWNPFTMNYEPLTKEQEEKLATAERGMEEQFGKRNPSLVNAIDSAVSGLRRLIPGAGEAAIPSGMEAEMGMGDGYRAPSTGGASGSWGESAAKPPSAPPQRAVPPAAGLSVGEAGTGGAGVRGFGIPKEPELGMGKRAEKYATDFESKFNEALKQWTSSVTAAEAKLTGKPLERFEAELEKEAREFGADKEQARNMAIFKAGLAMMAGTSRHALENIGKGAMVGAEDYQKAASEIKKAQKENQRMFALVDQTRRAELAGDRDRAIGLATEAMKARTKLAEHTMNALTHGYGLDQKERVTMYDTEYKTAGTVAAANARLEGMLERLGMRGELSGAKTFDARTKIIQNLKDENFELKQYRDLVNKNLKSDQLDAIKKDPRNARIVAEVENRRRNEIERRLSEGLGEYAPLQGQPVAGQPAGAPQMSIVGVRPQ